MSVGQSLRLLSAAGGFLDTYIGEGAIVYNGVRVIG